MISRVFCNHTVNLKTDSKTPYCVVPEYIHTLPREDSFICTPDLPGFSISGGLWWLSKFKICNLTYQNRYSPSSCFLGVLGIALSIYENQCLHLTNCQTLSQPKLLCNDIGVLNLHHSYYTTIMTSRWLFHYNPVSCDTNQPIRKLEFVQCMKVE